MEWNSVVGVTVDGGQLSGIQEAGTRDIPSSRLLERRLSRRSCVAFFLSLSGAVLAGCKGQPSASGDTALVAWPARNLWPAEFQKAAPEIQDAYRFAVANPNVLKYIPCFCGCVDQGYPSNTACYVQEFRSDGSVLLDPMSFG